MAGFRIYSFQIRNLQSAPLPFWFLASGFWLLIDIVEEGSAFIKEFFHEKAPNNLPNREKKQPVPT
jgi:hypothetical protein